MTTDIDKLAQQMREAAQKATPGPWRVVTDYPALAIGAGDYRVVQTPNQNNLRRFGPANNWDGIPSEANAAYIALANPAGVLALLDDRERLVAKLALHSGDGMSLQKEIDDLRAESAQMAEVFAAKEQECERLLAEAAAAKATMEMAATSGAFWARRAENAETALSAKEQECERLRKLIVWAYDTLGEINPSNYDHEDVCRLNDQSVEVILGLKEDALATSGGGNG